MINAQELGRVLDSTNSRWSFMTKEEIDGRVYLSNGVTTCSTLNTLGYIGYLGVN